jgi:hypothetical protein
VGSLLAPQHRPGAQVDNGYLMTVNQLPSRSMGSPSILLFSLGVVHEPADQPHEPPGRLLGRTCAQPEKQAKSRIGWSSIELVTAVRNAFCLFAQRKKYHHGGIGLSPLERPRPAGRRAPGRRRKRGPRNGIMAPSWPRRRPQFAGKRLGGPGSAPFGGRNGLELLFSRTREVLPQRGHDLPPPGARADG